MPAEFILIDTLKHRPLNSKFVPRNPTGLILIVADIVFEHGCCAQQLSQEAGTST